MIFPKNLQEPIFSLNIPIGGFSVENARSSIHLYIPLQMALLLLTSSTLETSLRILIVDDEPLVRQVLEFILTASGHKVEAFSDGAEALRIITHVPFDLVISDFRMPKMRGDELAVAIKMRLPDLPIILLTGNIELLDRKARDCDAVLEKPFSPDNLLRLVEEIHLRFKERMDTI